MLLKSSGAKLQLCLGVAVLAFSSGWRATPSSAAIIYLDDPIKLSELTGNPDAEVIAGDKRFTGFGYLYGGDMPSAAGVNVVPILDDLGDTDPDTGNFGLRFQGPFLDLASSPDGSDALITYMVEVTQPGYLISDAHLAGNPQRLGPYGSISVTETFFPLGPSGEYNMTIYNDESNPVPKMLDWTFFNPPVRKLNVQKDIIAKAVTNPNAPNEATTVTLSFVDQTFSQIVIPEPAAIALAMMGLAACGLARRPSRRRLAT